jgi:hypothetical protein
VKDKEEIKNKTIEKWEQAKWHVNNHKEACIGVAAGIVIGSVGALVVLSRPNAGAQISQRITGLIVWKPEQTIISLVDPGDLILVKETGEKYRSKNVAARALGISRPSLSKLGEGETGTFGRWTLTNIGKARTE